MSTPKARVALKEAELRERFARSRNAEDAALEHFTPEVFNLWHACHLWHFDQQIEALCLYFYVALLIQ